MATAKTKTKACAQCADNPLLRSVCAACGGSGSVDKAPPRSRKKAASPAEVQPEQLDLPEKPGPFTSPLSALRGVWGYPKFRPGQEQIINAVMSGCDVVAIAPTSFGKSCCFQVPSLVRQDRPVLVLSPLIALMRDQVQRALALGIPAVAVTSQHSPSELAKVMAAMPRACLIYAAPERFDNAMFHTQLSVNPPWLVAVDESHCFPAGTPVRVAEGRDAAIESLHPGDTILGVDGPRIVEACFKQATSAHAMVDVKTEDGENIPTTASHPFFVQGIGFLAAGDLEPGDEILRIKDVLPTVPETRIADGALRPVLQQSVLVHQEETRTPERIAAPLCALRRFVHSEERQSPRLQRSVQEHPLFTKVSSNHAAESWDGDTDLSDLLDRIYSQEIFNAEGMYSCVWAFSARGLFVGAHEEKQSLTLARSARDALQTRRSAQRGGRSPGEPWWEWETSTYTAPNGTWIFFRLSSQSIRRVCGDDESDKEQRAGSLLQSGCGCSGASLRGGSGRRFAQFSEGEGEGRAKGPSLVRDRVASVKSHKSRSAETASADPGENNERVDVYNLRVSGRVFFASGVLVHNSVGTEAGLSFRPAYRFVRDFLDRRNTGFDTQWLAVTASATEEVVQDIRDTFRMTRARLIRLSCDRPNLSYRVQTCPVSDKFREVKRLLDLHLKNGGAAIVYTLKRADAEELAAYIQARGRRALHYHAGMKKKGERQAVEEAFFSKSVDVVVATCAFGMGIDRSDVRLVCMAGMPKSPEDFYQMAGRAGRDGKPSVAVTLYDERRDYSFRRFLINSGEDLSKNQYSQRYGFSDDKFEQAKARQLDLLAAVDRFLRSWSCRAVLLRQYFGEEPGLPCGNCDNCLNQRVVAPPDRERVDRAVFQKPLLKPLGDIAEMMSDDFDEGDDEVPF